MGIYESPGVMTLALNKYRLHGVFLVLFLLGGLYIWKSATPLVPAGEDVNAQGGGNESGRDAWSGLVDLLVRNINRESIIKTCVQEWMRARPAGGNPHLAERLNAVLQEQEALPAKARNPVHAYRAMARILDRRRRAAGNEK